MNWLYGSSSLWTALIDFETETASGKRLQRSRKCGYRKELYMLPKSYAAQGGDSMDIGFNKEIYDANGTSILFVPSQYWL